MHSKVIKRYNIKKLGTTCEYIEVIECPYCKAEYARHITEGCFNVKIEPSLCPNCNYPLNDENLDKEVNPSRRGNIDRR